MKNILLTISLLLTLSLVAQEKGATPIQSTVGSPQSATTTRAVVIGISDYQNLPDLKYADRDAEAFAAFLQSPAGGSVPSENIHLFTNEKATGGAVNMELWWLLKESKEGDRAIIYFSGHGDMETKLIDQLGFLLCWDSQSFAYFAGGSVQVTNLQQIVSTLAQVNKTQVLLITDACRAGKLAGSAINGTGATTANLQNFTGATKILSCQPNEFSLEGEDWGGGRGAFSYHLIDGLYGLADNDKDLQIRLKEITRYLEDHVPVETAPHRQNPIVVGDREALMATVDETLLAQWEEKKRQRQLNLSAGGPKGWEDQILVQADTNIQQIYAAFVAAVEAGNLMAPAGASANDYYEILIHEPSIGQMHGMLTRNFVAALIDEAQQVTNKLLSNAEILSNSLFKPFSYDHIVGYLNRATELLGEGHFLYKQLKAKELYFEAKTYRKDKYPDWPADSLLKLYQNKLEESLMYDSMASYIYLDLVNHYFMNTSSDFYGPAMDYGRKLVEFLPQSAIANSLYGTGLAMTGESEKAHPYLETALTLDPNFIPSYIFMALVKSQTGKQEEYIYFLEEYVRKAKAMIDEQGESVPYFYVGQLSHAFQRLGCISEAEKVSLKAVELSKGQDPSAYMGLMIVYLVKEDWEQARQVLEKLVNDFPNKAPWFNYGWLGFVYEQLKEYEKAQSIYRRYISEAEGSSPIFRSANCDFANFYLNIGQSEKAKEIFESLSSYFERLNATFLDLDIRDKYVWLRTQSVLHGIEKMEETLSGLRDENQGNFEYYWLAAFQYALSGSDDKAILMLEHVVEISPFVAAPPAGLWMNTEFVPLRHHPGFEALVKKVFPEGIK